MKSKTYLLFPLTALLLGFLSSCKGSDTLLFDTERIDSVSIEYYVSFQLQGTVIIDDAETLEDFIARYASIPVVTDVRNEDDPYVTVNYPRGYDLIYNMDVHLKKTGLFKTEGTFWLQFGYNDETDSYRFVTFSGYEYRYTADYDVSEKTYLDTLYGANA